MFETSWYIQDKSGMLMRICVLTNNIDHTQPNWQKAVEMTLPLTVASDLHFHQMLTENFIVIWHFFCLVPTQIDVFNMMSVQIFATRTAGNSFSLVGSHRVGILSEQDLAVWGSNSGRDYEIDQKMCNASYAKELFALDIFVKKTGKHFIQMDLCSFNVYLFW